ncbi:MAG TPA: methyltransferase [Planctomycetota bacterium]|nr:methyltransferase [Planctomycetota bacterium]
MDALRCFALCARGLESVAADEIGALRGVRVVDHGYRRVALDADDPTPLIGLRTVDDVFVELARWDGIARERATLGRMAALSAALDLHGARRACARVRPLPATPSFALSASFVGKRNYSGEEMKHAVGDAMARTVGWNRRERDDEADVNVRLFIEHDRAHVGMRLARRPLQDRAYKLAHRPGSLKPPIAAAMLRLAGLRAGERVVDPFCGAGTVAVEAAALGARAIAGDRDAGAVAALRVNAGASGLAVAVAAWDAAAVALADGAADLVVTNPPWDRQVQVAGGLDRLYAAAGHEMLRILAPGGRIAVLTPEPDRLPLPGLRRLSCTAISLAGDTPSIVVLDRG